MGARGDGVVFVLGYVGKNIGDDENRKLALSREDDTDGVDSR